MLKHFFLGRSLYKAFWNNMAKVTDLLKVDWKTVSISRGNNSEAGIQLSLGWALSKAVFSQTVIPIIFLGRQENFFWHTGNSDTLVGTAIILLILVQLRYFQNVKLLWYNGPQIEN